MKKLIIYSLIISTIMFSCKEDGHTPSKKSVSNAFEYEGKSYKLDHGYVANEGPFFYDEGLNSWIISLISGQRDDPGNLVYVTLLSAAESDFLPEGKYTMNFEEDEIAYSGLVTDEDGLIDISLNASSVKEMEVVVSKSGSSYTIKFGITLQDGDKKIKGEFSGVLEEI